MRIATDPVVLVPSHESRPAHRTAGAKMQQATEWPERGVDLFFEFVSGRALAVSSLYWIGLTMLGDIGSKAAIVLD
jgi:hypothetical protein